jgi:hypothetical protein
MTKSDEKKIEKGRCIYLGFAKLVAVLGILMSARAAGATQENRSHTRYFLVPDNSGSMRQSARFRRAIQALERWVEGLDCNPDVTIELLVAADHVVHQGTIELRDENSRAQVLDRLRELKVERSSRTVFEKIDEELAAFIGKHTRPNERFGVVFVTDGRSDLPASDLRLQEMGDQVLSLSGGLYAAISGPIPAQENLVGGTRGRTPASQQEPAWSRSKYRRLLTPSVTIVEPSPMRAYLLEHLLGGFNPVRIRLEVKNSSEISREIRLRAHAPDGATGRFIPDTVVLPGGATKDVWLDVDVTSPVSGVILISAQAPDGSVTESRLNAEITTKSWLASNWISMGGSLVVLALLLVVLLTVSRRVWFVVPLGRPERGFYIRPGEDVPLSAADPGFPSGTWIRRRRGALWLRTDSEPMRVAGIAVQPGRNVRYRPHTPIDAGNASVVLDRRSRREAARHAVIIAGVSERAMPCDDLL